MQFVSPQEISIAAQQSSGFITRLQHGHPFVSPVKCAMFIETTKHRIYIQ